MSIIYKGGKELDKALKKMQNPEKFLDKAVYEVANETRDELQDNTPKWTHDAGSRDSTKRSWQRVKKISNAFYMIENDAKSRDGKHNIVDIIRYGRGEVRPKKAKKLFIPLNKKTAAKAKKRIYDNIKFGKDFILADKVKPSRPNDFISPVEDKMATKLEREILNSIGGLF